MSVAILLCAWEFAWLCPGGGSGGVAILTVVGSLAWQWLGDRGRHPRSSCRWWWPRCWSESGRRGELRAGVIRAAWTVLGVAYVGGLLTYGALLRNHGDGRQLIYFVTFTTWAADIGAYYVGSRCGRRALAPRVSPKKTIEGMLGGIAASVIVGVVGAAGSGPALAGIGALDRRCAGSDRDARRPGGIGRSSARPA